MDAQTIAGNVLSASGLKDRGRIESGAWADLVVLDRELRPIAVYVEGEPVEPIPS